MEKTVSDIKSIVFAGGSVALDAKKCTSIDLKSIAFISKTHNAKIIIKHSNVLTATDCKSIAFTSGGNGNVIMAGK